jgi:alkanesulfonate monooxygenase SsuD/methylene tetrahydromethanopterin reductase-like flavin-dependent oxidoreductase (luciferase family)
MVGAPTRSPRMPLVIAGNGPKTIRYAATHAEGWVTTGGNEDDREQWWTELAALARRFDDEYAASGRNDDVVRMVSLDIESDYSLASPAAYEDAVGRAAQLGFTDVIAHWPRAEGIYAGDESVLEEVAAMLPHLGPDR